ncbi:Non-repetitive/WGA-negative nucleoporin C-terminal-domain-containing protein [Annulohypoxylon truncatum]|uniref:Non-repetitive/WGA-negative nucleoporin C-terminal-domain-containing protein n=1 Tax=Annulohypoxylon truncatum TaxID=327061 RepID=UPI002007FDBD|nr:Non-repetitive/WGA-negative nucleoporin C-terminal-domain-containing protein [Annulohypoxylon truncatum]KAI1207369.1 Non-repetitive/WGA-negative nucleoporin C-terminal-domain-containing protein [Annulohypoxylon truncatum]
MFSASLRDGVENASPAPTITRGRRRQRPLSSENSPQQPKAKRQRVPLNEQTFVNPTTAPETYEVKSTRTSLVELKQDGIEESPASKQELSFRSKKARPSERFSKGDGSTLLSTNIAFDVRKLPALPDRLKLDATSLQHGSADSSTGYALSLSHTHAIVWPYATPTQSPESFTFTLPYPSKHSTDPLPQGALVPPSASSSEPGLVVVMPTSGKVTYWESISSATTLDFMQQQRNGIEGSIQGIFSGEAVIQIIHAESAAGFILAFSSGRMAYLSVRDAHGRPKVSTLFLRTNLGPASSGFFGSIRHALSHSALQGDIAAVRSERSSKQGECTVVAATSKGRLHSWRVHRGGHHDLLAEVDARSTIIEALQRIDKTNARLPAESLKILDFCFVPRGLERKYSDMNRLLDSPESEDQQHILLLASLSSKQSWRYTLVEVVISTSLSPDNPIDIGMVRPISAYSTPPDAHALAKPRLYLPRPNIIAFLVFDHAAVVASIALPPFSPESQILEDNHLLPASFEDVVDLRTDPTLEIVGSGIEEPRSYGFGAADGRTPRIRPKNPAAVLMVRGAGTLRIALTDVERFASDKPPEVTAKAKLEQAVFFGVKEDSPLVFNIQHGLRFTDAEYGAAALELSREILTSAGKHFSSLAARVDTNIKERVQYLEKIMSQIASLGVNLDRVTKWQLLWNAEKLHVANVLWHKHEDFTNLRPTSSKKSIVAEIVEYIRSEEKSEPNIAKGEVDELRHWFIRDVDRMEIFIAWAYEVIKHNSKANLDQASLTCLIYEAAEIYNSAIRGAFTFRVNNLELYGLAGEKLEHGILANNYNGLPTPWTCHPFIANNVKRQVELSTEWVKQHWTSESDSQNVLIQRTRELLPQMTEIYLTVVQELSRSYLSSDDPKKAIDGQKYEAIYEQDRHDKIVLLAQTENWEAGISIAENHESLPALAEILTREIDGLRHQLETGLTPERAAKIESKITAKEERVQEYFRSYGKEFAFPFYEYLFTTYGVDALLEYDSDKKFKTMYLRTKPELAKVSWINDIIGEEDIDHAADTLLDLGLAREQQVWNKKIELSLGKLARMAESSRPSSKASMSIQEASVSGTTEDARVDAIDKELTIIGVQDDLYNTQIRPVISVALEGEELSLVQETFALKIPKKYKILSQIFEDSLRRLLDHEALDPLTLIDILTLITLPPETREHMPDQFFQAILVAHNGLIGADRVQAERLIWRRCFLREDWMQINNTSLKNDNDIVEVLGQTDLFQFYCTLYANQQNGGDKTNYRRLSPSEVAGVYTETLDRRFEKMEKSYREKVLEVMRWEDSNLLKHIEKHRLEQWAKETRKYAEEAVDQQYDESTAAGAALSSPKSGTARKQIRAFEGTNGQNGTH